MSKQWAKICKGKDITGQFPVLTNGQAISLQGRDLKLLIKDSNGNVYEPAFSILNGINVKFTFPGASQRFLGIHSVRLWENAEKPGQRMYDINNAFELVRTTEEEGISSNDVMPDAMAKGFYDVTINIDAHGASYAEPVIDGTALVFSEDCVEVNDGALIIR